MSGSALEGGAVLEGESQAAIRIGRGVVQQATPELFAEGGNLAVLLFQNSEEVLHRAAPFEDVADLLRDGVLLGLGLFELLAEGIEALVVFGLVLHDRGVLPDHHYHVRCAAAFLAAKLGIDLLILQVVRFHLDVVKRGKVLCGGGDAAGVAVDHEGARLGEGLFHQLVMGQTIIIRRRKNGLNLQAGSARFRTS